MEEWREIEGYEGLYWVSNRGRVKSAAGKSNHKKEIILRGFGARKGGYQAVWLYNGHTKVAYPISRLVASAFLPRKDSETIVVHKDGNNKNNKVNNLKWMSRSGLLNSISDEKGRYYKTATRKVKCIETNKVYCSLQEAARDVGGYSSCIHMVASGKARTHCGKHWEFVD